MLLEKIALKALAVLAAMAVCFAVGYDLGGDKQKAKQIEAVIQTQTDSKNEVLESQAKSISVEERVTASTQKIESIKDEAVKRIEANEPKVTIKSVGVSTNDSNSIGEQSSGEPAVVEDTRSWTFDSGTVRLLNSARSNDTDSTASIDYATDQSPTDITIGKFVENDLEIVSLYQDQSVRFKALQDYVKEKQDQGYMFCRTE